MRGKANHAGRLLCVLLLLVVAGHLSAAESRDSLWNQVDEAIQNRLPRTAITVLDEIIPGALEDQAYAEATRAICLKIALEGQIQGGKAEEKIVLLETEIANAPEEMKPVMETILAYWYWQYFQQNSWRFIERTQTAEPPGADITTWDLPRILAEIDRHFTLALDAEQELKTIPTDDWDDLLEKGTVPDSYRPTLYDFLAFEALSFYSAGEQAGTIPQDAFEIMADSPVFGSVAEFLAWQPETSNTDSAKLKAIGLYQDLLAFHQDDSDKSAFIDADLNRLMFGYNHALGPDKTALYIAAMERLVEKWADHEIAARAQYEWARAVHSQGDYVQAHALAGRGWETYPDSIGGAQCYNLIQQIEARSASIKTERVWNDPMPDIQVTYRNVTRVFFRAIPLSAEEAIQPVWQSISRDEMEILLTRFEPVLQWDADLPATVDYQQRTEALPAPDGLEKGFYFIIASHDPSFEKSNNNISVARIWVSDLAIVLQSHYQDGLVEGFVFDANSGEPLADAKVTRWRYGYSTCWLDGQTSTDENGLFSFSYNGDMTDTYLFVAEYEGQKLATKNAYRIYSAQSDPVLREQTIFFTDRSLYRPGQTIHYKGICIHTDRTGDNYRTLAGKSLIVVFRDTNHQEIARQEHKCNDYGAFSGSFTAPRDRLMGRMYLIVHLGPRGSTWLNVEEYKRPKFRVQLDAPAEAPRLDTEVVVPGMATAYTGAAIGGAQVEWRVVRQVRFPFWCWWARWIYPSANEQAIAHGSTVTETDGSFSILFTAKPDMSILEEDEPIFEYRIYADVTDTTGETRSDEHTVRAGYTALTATIQADTWQTKDKPVELKITTQSIDYEPEPAEGTVQIYALKQPDRVIRAKMGSTGSLPDPSNPDTWEPADLVSEYSFQTDAQGQATLSVILEAGIYRALLETQDRFGKSVAAQHTIHVVDPQAEHFSVHVANHFAAPTWSVEPGESFMALWGTGYDTGRAYVELECRGKLLRAWWTDPNRTQEVIEEEVTENMRGGFTLRVMYVRENRAYLNERIVNVPWTNKQLTIQWERFRSLLEPGQEEVWTAVITGPDANRAVAEMVAGMYDASLDQYLQHYWTQSFGGFRSESKRLSSRFENSTLSFRNVLSGWSVDYIYLDFSYRHFPYDIVYPYYGGGGAGGGAAPPPSGRGGGGDETTSSYSENDQEQEDKTGQEPAPDLSQVSARENLNETAFFFPHLLSDADGVVRIEFTIPEALTEWRFMGFAHDNQLRSGFLTDTTVTAKDLMVEPNPPRFVREGDIIEFTVKVTNQSAARQTGKVSLILTDARTLEPRDEALGNLSPEQTFDVPSHESRTYSWRLTVPDECDFLTYKAVGATSRLSDGEEGYLPVLSRRILVTESLPLPVRGPQTKEFEFTKLLNSGQSQTLRHQSLTVQMVSQPAWYAVMALPYLMEYPYDCSELIFNRLYANTLASYIANADPKIRRIFDQWKATPALDSPLEKNEDLKAVTLEETPWIRQAVAESQARKNVGILFDENRLNDETSRTLFKLQQMQLDSGLWPWFPGCTGSRYITLYITTGFGRLRHLGVNQMDVSCAIKALGALDKWMDERYRWILEHGDKDENHLSSTIALYLYGRSFFLTDKPVDSQYQEALEYWLEQARQYWTKLWRQSQAHLAIALKRFGDLQVPDQIMQSIREYSVTDDELGMYWRDTERSWWWYRAPIETQAMMIEAFDEVSGDAQAVEDCRVWLLKQKQTQDWKTTKATADAIYGLLLRGADFLASDALVEVALGGQWIQPENVEAGTGFYEERFIRGEIEPAMGHITVKKVDEGVSWGSVHWQYLEDMSKVTPYEGTPLQLTKTLFVKKTTNQGQVLYPISDSLNVGDELVVRIELRVDRDMEYVHLKDQRGSGTEPVNVLSRYRYQDGLGYYESTRDTATHFFMDYLPKGVYVFEYSTRIQHKGKYQTGMAAIQCMYAPEFNSHSESFDLEVR
ncbi:MAG: alpha-2-macroglobulin family protein [Sedimentisphaerales bacterium]